MTPTDFVAGLVNDKCDPELGARVREHLVSLGYEPAANIDPDSASAPSYTPALAHSCLMDGIRNAFINLGLDVRNDPSIQDTPRRFANMFVGELTKGLNYDFFPKCTATPNGTETEEANPLYELWQHNLSKNDLPQPAFAPPPTIKKITGKYDQMVLVRGIQTISLCEHHLQTIDGHTHIAYIPNKSVLGLSKFARVTEFFAARPQIQERMTDQIYAALSYILDTPDIAVVQKAQHFCMKARGAKQPSSDTVTDKMGGRFLSQPALRQEFLNAIGH